MHLGFQTLVPDREWGIRTVGKPATFMDRKREWTLRRQANHDARTANCHRSSISYGDACGEREASGAKIGHEKIYPRDDRRSEAIEEKGFLPSDTEGCSEGIGEGSDASARAGGSSGLVESATIQGRCGAGEATRLSGVSKRTGTDKFLRRSFAE